MKVLSHFGRTQYLGCFTCAPLFPRLSPKWWTLESTLRILISALKLFSFARTRNFTDGKDMRATSARLYYQSDWLLEQFVIRSKQLDKIQRAQNTAGRIIFRLPKFCHITPSLFSLHWLPVRYRIDFKICLLTFKAIHGSAPSYLRELVVLKENPCYRLRSSNQLLFCMSKGITKKTVGNRAFAVTSPRLWIYLPE